MSRYGNDPRVTLNAGGTATVVDGRGVWTVRMDEADWWCGFNPGHELDVAVEDRDAMIALIVGDPQ